VDCGLTGDHTSCIVTFALQLSLMQDMMMTSSLTCCFRRHDQVKLVGYSIPVKVPPHT